jgi:formylglycine-generating enzyme required for sulfatase activity
MTMIRIPAGSFRMGADRSTDSYAESYESWVHKISLSVFWLSDREVTEAQLRAIHGDDASGATDAEMPANYVSWLGAARFCNELSDREGFQRYYDLDSDPPRPLNTDGYRLPTEAEWECACRATSTTQFCFGDEREMGDPEWLARYAVFSTSYSVSLSVGGKRLPSGWGLFDMHGNVYEWCHDWYDAGYYASSPDTDPLGPSQGSTRVRRGGSYDSSAESCRSAHRYRGYPESTGNGLGFRVARSLSGNESSK